MAICSVEWETLILNRTELSPLRRLPKKVFTVGYTYTCIKFSLNLSVGASGERVKYNKIILPAKARGYVFTGIGLSVCLSVNVITKRIADGFVPNFMGRFLGGKGSPSLCFVTIGRWMWK